MTTAPSEGICLAVSTPDGIEPLVLMANDGTIVIPASVEDLRDNAACVREHCSTTALALHMAVEIMRLRAIIAGTPPVQPPSDN